MDAPHAATRPDIDSARPPEATLCIAHKFGGTSLANAERFRAVAALLAARTEALQVVVVSAMRGVTDALLALAHQAARRDPAWREAWLALRQRHLDTARELLGSDDGEIRAAFETQFDDLADVLHAAHLLGTPAAELLDFVQGLGEVFAARLLAAAMRALHDGAEFLDAREVLVVRHEELGVAVDWPESERRLAAWRAIHPARRVVVTGFVACDANGRATTLGRNGSDYSGAIFGALFDAAEIQIWTDVDGVLSADPRLVPEAVTVSRLSYDEACELAYFGAKVVHPQTMGPAIARGIPIRIRNTLRPEHPGTAIGRERSLEPPVKGITTIDNLALVSVEGAGMIGVPGTAERLFGALHRAGISVVMISQGSSEHSICCVVEERVAPRAVIVLEDAFARELDRGQIQRVSVSAGVSVLAAVGDGMAGTPGIAARLFDSLGRSRINVRAIAQGASERNISVAIASQDSARALRAVHAGFYLSAQTLSLGVVGPGQVGRALLAQLREAQPRLRRDHNIDLRIRGIATSKRMLLDDGAIALESWRERLEGEGDGVDLARFATHVQAPHLPHAVIVDCSASGDVAEHYAGWLAAGIHVITPNKHAGSGPRARYAAIRAARAGRFRYEATVGAGLPIIQTLRDLLDTGDEVHAIEGILSGTLAYLFHHFDGGVPFSRLVADARAAGYTEPDPRDDLSGTDVARKLVILGRELGLDLGLEDVVVESLVPEPLQGVSREAFLAGLAGLDAPITARFAAARANGKVLRYVARLDRAGTARVGLVEVAREHPFANTRPTDNVVQFTTRRYFDNPLVVQGPGAGPEVTAAGVFADLLRVAASLGAWV